MRPSLPLACALFAVAASPTATAQSCDPFRVLVFTKTAGFVHGPQIAAGITLIQALGSANGFAVDQTADATAFTAANLAQYSVIVFLHTTGDVLDAGQQVAFESWNASGGGFVGIHSAADTEYGWPFYGPMLGSWFAGHPPTQTGTLNVVDPSHPSTTALPLSFAHNEEWYNFATNVATNPLFDVLLTVDESSYVGGSMGAVHPISWCRDSGNWRSWYTALGHTLPQYSQPWFASHLLGGIQWAAGSLRARSVCGTQSYGAASGAGAVALAAMLQPPQVTLQLSGATAGGVGVFGLSTCPANASLGGITFLIDLAAPAFLGLVTMTFDATGRAQFALPLALQLPGVWGNSLWLQGAEIVPTLALSNGLQLVTCP
jgi:type 1 glutamine amidotransferase